MQKVVSFIEARGNPFETAAASKLHNFTTGQCVPEEVSVRLLNFFENGKEGYTNFRKERFIEKNKKLSDTIKRVNLPAFDPIYKSMPVTTNTTSKLAIKELSQAQRLIDIARSRMISMTELLKFDMGIQNSLFDGEFTAKPDKYLLVSELEKSLVGTTYKFKTDNFRPTALIVDFMSLIRKMNLSKMRIFNDVLEAVWNLIKNVCIFNQLDMVYDSYIMNSVKYCERIRRSSCHPLEFVNLTQQSFIPVQIDTFWACTTNKENLQLLSRDFFAKKSEENHLNIILSGYLKDDSEGESCVQCKDGVHLDRHDLHSELEEADVRIIPHIAKAIENCHKCIVVLSNGTDVVVLLLHYIHHFFAVGLSGLWIRFGTNDKTRHIPIHNLGEVIGSDMCSVILKAHILAGCDVTSKIGTKPAASKNRPEKYLKRFGEDETSHSSFQDAENYLVNVLYPTTKCTTFDQLRHELYMLKSRPLSELPPTSHSVRGHLDHCYYIINQQIIW